MITEPPPENGVLDFSSLFSPEYLLEEAIGPPKAAVHVILHDHNE
jgi:hypothetical protein